MLNLVKSEIFQVNWVLEEWFGRSIKVEIWDYDSSMTDDFMGKR